MSPGLLSAHEIAAQIRSGAVTARWVVAEALDEITRTHAQINAFTAVTRDRALREADAIDAMIKSGATVGPLAGVPFAVKNLFDVAGVTTVAGSKMLRTSAPAAEDSTAVARLCAAGGICVGALNMGEFAYDFTTENSHDGPTHNPRDLTRSAGGSSGGSAAAVAAGLVPLTVGTDTNGSIRVPSSFCGTWGLKPTFGRLSRAGAFLFVESLDHIGPFARDVADLALAYDALQGPDDRDPVCTKRPPAPAMPTLEQGVAGLRIGILGGYFEEGGAPEVHAAVQAVAAELRVTKRVELPTPGLARAAAYIITATEGGNRHLESLRTRAAEFDPQTRDRFIAGALNPSGWYLHAQKFRARWRDEVRTVFRDFDVLLAPATPVPATRIGQEMMKFGGAEIPVRPNLGIFTQPISFIGLPVVAAPVQSGPLPVAVQLIGAPWTEDVLLRVARVLERSGVCNAAASPIAA